MRERKRYSEFWELKVALRKRFPVSLRRGRKDGRRGEREIELNEGGLNPSSFSFSYLVASQGYDSTSSTEE